MTVYKSSGISALLFAVLFVISGCAGEKKAAEKPANSTPTATATSDDHSGWWCPEHAIPEEVCSMCSADAAADCKAKGDWCEEHNRAASQCFICDPSRAEKFAKLYEAKYGTQPPPAIE